MSNLFCHLLRRRSLLGLFVAAFLLAVCACTPTTAKRSPAKQYRLAGRVVSVNLKARTASIDAAAIPNYMEAMTMDYPIAAEAKIDRLRAGEQIEGTLDVFDSGDYVLHDIHPAQASK